MSRRWLAPGLALVAAAALAFSGLPALGLALRIAFALASAAPIGSVLLLAIARLTGADWSAAAPATHALPWLVPLGALAMLAPTGVPLPAHLAIWSHALFAASRAAAVLAALVFAAHRLRGGAGATTAGVTLAIYTALVTPIAADWLLPTAPGHPVSAVGMMLFVLQFGAACALALLGAEGRVRRDLALLLVAAVLGLCYLVYMDYLIVWYGNLPSHVPFYIARVGWIALAALLIGLGGTLAAVIAGRTRFAARAAALGFVLFALWWIGGGLVAALVAVLSLLALAYTYREFAHG